MARPDLMNGLPLFVDLDRTLVATDTLHEALFPWIARRPWRLGQLLAATFGDRARLKHRLQEDDAMPDASTLPYREDVLEFLERESARGRTLILATACHRRLAERIADHLGIFEGVLATGDSENLKGARKLHRIREFCDQQEWAEFAYMGDSRSDLVIWRHASEVLAVRPPGAVTRRLGRLRSPVRILDGDRRSTIRALWKSLRPHHWVKNTLVFVPMILAHEWLDPAKIVAAVVAFVAFSLTASSVYLVNDLMDLDADRRHSTKRKRPLASGELSVGTAIVAAVVLLVGSFGAATILSPTAFVLALALYYGLTLSYSISLKRRLLIDVFVLAGLYTIRLLAGGYATSTSVSAWLLAFSVFLFTSLAFAKRYTELSGMKESRAAGRAYQREDLDIILTVGPTSGYLAALVLALYINSEQVNTLYADPGVLWLLCPLVLYWITRVWFFAARRDLHEDPIAFAFQDRVTWLTGATAAAIVALATTGMGPVLP